VPNRRSPLFYVGDKFKLLDQLLPLFPEQVNNFYEPFVGGGSVAMNVSAKNFYLSDQLDPLISIHNALASFKSPEELMMKLEALSKTHGLKASYFGDQVKQELKKAHPKTYFAVRNKESFNALRSHYNKSNPKDPLVLYLLVIFGFNRLLRFNSSGEFNVPVGNVDFNANTAAALADYVNWSKQSHPTFSVSDYKKALNRKFQVDDFVYVDPPYLIAEAEYNKSWGENQEQELLNVLDELSDKNVRWALSNALVYRGRENVQLKKWASKYRVHRLRASYLNYHNNLDKDSGEVLVTNYA
jgi:DNA adenine methylase